MSRILSASWGVVLVVVGIGWSLWISYLLFVDNREQVEFEGFVLGYVVSFGAVAIGIRRIRGQPVTGRRPDRSDD